MNIALILAGGTDPKFQKSVPKQFVNVFNRPVIVYTLEAFQKHKDIDAIMVACLDGWQEMVNAYAKQFNIDKLKWVITGGNDIRSHCKMQKVWFGTCGYEMSENDYQNAGRYKRKSGD